MIEPLRDVDAGIGRELTEIVPDFAFDKTLVDYSGDDLIAVLKAVFTEFMSVSQVVALCQAVGVNTMAELKSKMAP